MQPYDIVKCIKDYYIVEENKKILRFKSGITYQINEVFDKAFVTVFPINEKNNSRASYYSWNIERFSINKQILGDQFSDYFDIKSIKAIKNKPLISLTSSRNKVENIPIDKFDIIKGQFKKDVKFSWHSVEYNKFSVKSKYVKSLCIDYKQEIWEDRFEDYANTKIDSPKFELYKSTKNLELKGFCFSDRSHIKEYRLYRNISTEELNFNEYQLDTLHLKRFNVEKLLIDSKQLKIVSSRIKHLGVNIDNLENINIYNSEILDTNLDIREDHLSCGYKVYAYKNADGTYTSSISSILLTEEQFSDWCESFNLIKFKEYYKLKSGKFIFTGYCSPHYFSYDLGVYFNNDLMYVSTHHLGDTRNHHHIDLWYDIKNKTLLTKYRDFKEYRELESKEVTLDHINTLQKLKEDHRFNKEFFKKLDRSELAQTIAFKEPIKFDKLDWSTIDEEIISLKYDHKSSSWFFNKIDKCSWSDREELKSFKFNKINIDINDKRLKQDRDSYIIRPGYEYHHLHIKFRNLLSNLSDRKLVSYSDKMQKCDFDLTNFVNESKYEILTTDKHIYRKIEDLNKFEKEELANVDSRSGINSIMSINIDEAKTLSKKYKFKLHLDKIIVVDDLVKYQGFNRLTDFKKYEIEKLGHSKLNINASIFKLKYKNFFDFLYTNDEITRNDRPLIKIGDKIVRLSGDYTRDIYYGTNEIIQNGKIYTYKQGSSDNKYLMIWDLLMQNNFEYKFVEIEITEKQFTDFTKVIEDLITRKSQYVREWNMNHFKKTYDFIQLLAFDEVNSIFHDIELTDKELKSLNKWRDLFRKKYENL